MHTYRDPNMSAELTSRPHRILDLYVSNFESLENLQKISADNYGEDAILPQVNFTCQALFFRIVKKDGNWLEMLIAFWGYN